MSNDNLFGAPLLLDAFQRDQWIATLTRTWTAQMGARPRRLGDDLDDLSSLFGTGTRPKALRERVHALKPAERDSSELPSAAVLVVDGSPLVTPEGRILLDVLSELQRAGSTVIGREQQVRALQTAVEVRSAWHVKWMLKQFDGSLSASALGAALFLLINRSIGPQRGLLLPKDAIADRELGDVILPLLAQFSKDLNGEIPATAGGVRGHWAFTQISRLLGREVARDTTPLGTVTYVRAGQDNALLDDLASRLQRLETDPHRRRVAVLGFIDGYRRVRGVFAALGQMHEEPTATRRVTARLTDPDPSL